MFIIEMFNDVDQNWDECPFTGSFRTTDKAQDAIDSLRAVNQYANTYFRVAEKNSANVLRDESGEVVKRGRGRPKGSKDRAPRKRRTKQELAALVEDGIDDRAEEVNAPTMAEVVRHSGINSVPYRGVQDAVDIYPTLVEDSPAEMDDTAPDSKAA